MRLQCYIYMSKSVEQTRILWDGIPEICEIFVERHDYNVFLQARWNVVPPPDLSALSSERISLIKFDEQFTNYLVSFRLISLTFF